MSGVEPGTPHTESQALTSQATRQPQGSNIKFFPYCFILFHEKQKCHVGSRTQDPPNPHTLKAKHLPPRLPDNHKKATLNSFLIVSLYFHE